MRDAETSEQSTCCRLHRAFLDVLSPDASRPFHPRADAKIHLRSTLKFRRQCPTSFQITRASTPRFIVSLARAIALRSLAMRESSAPSCGLDGVVAAAEKIAVSCERLREGISGGLGWCNDEDRRPLRDVPARQPMQTAHSPARNPLGPRHKRLRHRIERHRPHRCLGEVKHRRLTGTGLQTVSRDLPIHVGAQLCERRLADGQHNIGKVLLDGARGGFEHADEVFWAKGGSDGREGALVLRIHLLRTGLPGLWQYPRKLYSPRRIACQQRRLRVRGFAPQRQGSCQMGQRPTRSTNPDEHPLFVFNLEVISNRQRLHLLKFAACRRHPVKRHVHVPEMAHNATVDLPGLGGICMKRGSALGLDGHKASLPCGVTSGSDSLHTASRPSHSERSRST